MEIERSKNGENDQGQVDMYLQRETRKKYSRESGKEQWDDHTFSTPWVWGGAVW